MRGYVTQKKSNMKWYPVIYLGKNELTGKRQYKWGDGCATKRQAESGLIDLLAMYKSGDKRIEVNRCRDYSTLKEVFEEWKPIVKEEGLYESGTSYDTATGYIQNHVIPILGDARIERIETKHIRQCFAMMKNKRKDGEGKPLSNATKKKIIGTLNHIFEYAIEAGWCETNPCSGVKIKEPDTPPKVIWLIDDILYFLEWVKNNRPYEYYLAYLILATTAARRGEVDELRYQDLIGDESITIARSVKTNGEVKDIKTGSKGRRTIVLFEMAQEAIECQKERQQRIIDQYQNKSGIDNKVKPWDRIITDDRNFPVQPQYLSRTFKSCIEEINKSGEHYLVPMPMKNLRHCFATHGLANGVNIPDMAAQLGHSRPSTTQNSYNQYQESMQKANRDKMEAMYFGKWQENRQEKRRNAAGNEKA
jgi:site-specific recombinase XerD